MLVNQTDSIREKVWKLGVGYIGAISYDVELEHTFGNVQRLLDSQFAMAVAACASELE
jgi:hypothetical protein